MTLKTPEQVRDIAAALRAVTEEELRPGYFAIKAHSYGMPLSDEDFRYTWDCFQGGPRPIQPGRRTRKICSVYCRPLTTPNQGTCVELGYAAARVIFEQDLGDHQILDGEMQRGQLHCCSSMSLWRKEASKRLPEFQRIISSREVDNPMMLWIQLHWKFQDLCEQEPPPIETIRRVWQYARWCMERGHDEVRTAAALGFCEHLLDRETTRLMLPKIMNRQDYEGLRELLLYHNSEADFVDALKLFESNS